MPLHKTMLLYLKIKKANKQKHVHRILKVHPVSSLAPHISGLYTCTVHLVVKTISLLLKHAPRNVRFDLIRIEASMHAFA